MKYVHVPDKASVGGHGHGHGSGKNATVDIKSSMLSNLVLKKPPRNSHGPSHGHEGHIHAPNPL